MGILCHRTQGHVLVLPPAHCDIDRVLRAVQVVTVGRLRATRSCVSIDVQRVNLEHFFVPKSRDAVAIGVAQSHA